MAVRAAGRELESRITRTSPVDTGALRSSTSVRTRELRTSVSIGVDYASFVREGTRPHRIVARNASVLRFRWPAGPARLRGRDGFYYFRSVNHPGTRANDWYDRALLSWPETVRATLR